MVQDLHSTPMGTPITCLKHKFPKQKYELSTKKHTLSIRDLLSNEIVELRGFLTKFEDLLYTLI